MLSIKKEKNYNSKSTRKIYINYKGLTLILHQKKFLSYILAILLAYKNYNLSKGKIKNFYEKNELIENFQINLKENSNTILLQSKNFKIEITPREFSVLSKILERELNEIVDLSPYSIKDFEIIFLHSCGEDLLKIRNIVIENIKISNLYGSIHSNFGHADNTQTLVHISDVPCYKYMQGLTNDFLEYKQYNYHTIENHTRVNTLFESIKQNGYPFKNNYIILFNDNSIKDGLHRASILAYHLGLDVEIPIMRFIIEEENFNQEEETNNLMFSKHFNELILQTNKLKKKYSKIALYGNGTISQFIQQFITPVIILDKDPKFSEEKKVYHPKELHKFDFDCIIITVLGREDSIKRYLNSLDIKTEIKTINLL